MGYKHAKRRKGLFKHLVSVGFTNRLAIYVLIFLAAGLLGGFYLALESIRYGYMGALMCWTVVFTPIGTVAALVVGKVVDKNRDENTGGNGDGITFAAAQANGFVKEDNNDSPAI